jgi:hypothetical protein
VGARKDGSGLLESVEAGNWMVHVDLRDFLNRDLGIYIYHGYETKDRTGKNNLIEWKEKGHFLCRGNMRVTEVGWFDSQYEQTMPNTAAPCQDICRVRYLCITNTVSLHLSLQTSSLLSDSIQLGSLSPNSQSRVCSIATSTDQPPPGRP